MKAVLSSFWILTLSNLLIGQTTAIPDANFEQALINLRYDAGSPDGTVITASIDIDAPAGIYLLPVETSKGESHAVQVIKE